MSKRCVIISGGEYSPITDINNEDFVIACDKGFEYAQKDGITPDLLIGDFDSYTGVLDVDIPIQRYKCEKDDTDTGIAVQYAVENEFDEIVLYCALGGRLDHTMGNIQIAAFAASRGLKVSIISETNLLYFLSNSQLSLNRRNGYSISLFSLTDSCQKLYVSGAKYPLRHAVFNNTSALGVSNEWVDDVIDVSVGEGILLIVLSKF